jgi:hypothetical protein
MPACIFQLSTCLKNIIIPAEVLGFGWKAQHSHQPCLRDQRAIASEEE